MASATLLGLDIGGTKTRVVLGAIDGTPFLHREFATRADRSFDAWFVEMASVADEILAAGRREGRPAPVAVSAAVGGPLEIDAGIVHAPPNLPTWDSAPLKLRLVQRFRLPAFIEHDGNAGALAELYRGAGRGLQSLVFLTLGTGLGAGIIVNGEVLRGATDTAGEVGHMRIAPDGPLAYGKAGSWEGYSSAAGLERMADVRAPGTFGMPASARRILEAARAGDPAAVSLIDEMVIWLGRGIATLVDILNPQTVIVGTLGVVLGEALLAPARAVVAAEALPVAAAACAIVPAALGDDLGNVAALMAASHAWRRGKLPIGAEESVRLALEAGRVVRESTIRALTPEIVSSGDRLVDALKKGGKVLTCGNGGSAVAAAHFAGELIGRYRAERQPLPAISLAADGGVLTCIANDYSFEDVFARQVAALAAPGDVVVGFTTSGRSKNVLRALEVARQRGAATIVLTGERGLSGGTAEHVLRIASSSTAHIQEEHEAIMHIWCEAIDRAFAP